MGKEPTTRDKILDAAFELFTEEPYSKVRIDDIVQKSGISKGGIFHYFESKKDLAVESLLFGVKKLWSPFLLKVREKGSPEKKMKELIDFTFDVFMQKPKLARFSLEMQELGLTPVVQKGLDYVLEYVRAFETLFLECNVPNPTYRAHLFHACLDGLAMQFLTMNEEGVKWFDIEELKKALFDVFLGKDTKGD